MEEKLLTPLELKVMNLLWKLKKAFVKEIIAEWGEEPQPAYNTVSTIVRILEEKEFVGHEAQGRSHRYFPLMSKGQYQRRYLKNTVENVFSGSLKGLVSTLLNSGSLSKKEIEELRDLIDKSEGE
jgi:predicted transcriptional regulator